MADLEHIYADGRKKLEKRLTPFRLLHSISTSDIAGLMANVYGVNNEYAVLAGLLHDWDKNYTDAQLMKRAEVFNIDLTDDPRHLASLLHAQTGACALAKEYKDLPAEIIQAIARHTSAATDMSELDMIIYIADMIEPLRSASNLQHLRTLAGNIPLEELFIKCYRDTLEHLIRRQRYIHPGSVEVWNAYAARKHGKTGKG
ncbi:MAG: bis(5'-nucleosyl)-tetraphosphatase (symmetrical) YqeK [Coriobacteriales bacterium]|jgi:predicted HD superfamily hydrolase involved in NAD metabolism|nr:bis(5'-nucleosyl)-tetraphosphatase (symmetrical) YqeK [Coriobacteriales bacterium]